MLHNSKVIWKDNTTLIDLSLKLSDLYEQSQSFDFVAADDKLYLGSDFAFNHRFIDVKRANTATAAISQIETYNGNSWDPVAEILDDTSRSGVTLAQSGIVAWTPDRNKSWGRTGSTEDISELSTLKIYDKYWVRFTLSANLSGCELNYVGHRFSNDNDLKARYPDLMNPDSMNAFQQGKTNWKEQHILASEDLIRDLKKDQRLYNENQILDWQLFSDAAVHKVAAIIFNAFGRDYVDNLDNANVEYKSSLNKKVYNIDKNNNAILRPTEKVISVGFRRV